MKETCHDPSTEGNCSCGSSYSGETIRNSGIAFSKYEQVNGKSEPPKHLISNIAHEFDWKVLTRAPSNCLKRKILENYFIQQ